MSVSQTVHSVRPIHLGKEEVRVNRGPTTMHAVQLLWIPVYSSRTESLPKISYVFIRIKTLWLKSHLKIHKFCSIFSPACAWYPPKAASRKTLEIYIAEEKADQQKRHDENRNFQSPQNDSIAVVNHEDNPKNTSGTGTLPNTTTLANPTMATNIITSVTPTNRSSTGSSKYWQKVAI